MRARVGDGLRVRMTTGECYSGVVIEMEWPFYRLANPARHFWEMSCDGMIERADPVDPRRWFNMTQAATVQVITDDDDTCEIYVDTDEETGEIYLEQAYSEDP